MRDLTLVVGCALGLLFNPGVACAKPAVITVHVIDARNGKPYKKLHLRVEFLKAEWSRQGYRSASEARANLVATKLGRTNDEGEVTVELPAPLPGVICIDAGLTGCGPGYFDTQAVTKEGVVGENRCKTKWAEMKVNFQAKPGEIIYFATHVGFFEGALTK